MISLVSALLEGRGTTARGAAAPLLRLGALRGLTSAGRTGSPGSPHPLPALDAEGWCASATTARTCQAMQQAVQQWRKAPHWQYRHHTAAVMLQFTTSYQACCMLRQACTVARSDNNSLQAHLPLALLRS
jgi:hypothetical protein